MRYQGRLSDWDDHKGFGFVVPHGGGERAFVHIGAFGSQRRRPCNGDVLTYAVQRDAHARLKATQVRWADRSTQARTRQRGSGLPRKFIAVVFLGAIVAAVVLQRLPLLVLLWYVAASAVAVLAYAIDKSAAQRNQWRTPEATLHLIGVLGGWPGALLAQEWFRHKCSKAAFQLTFWITAGLNVGLLLWAWLQPGLMATLRAVLD